MQRPHKIIFKIGCSLGAVALMSAATTRAPDSKLSRDPAAAASGLMITSLVPEIHVPNISSFIATGQTDTGLPELTQAVSKLDHASNSEGHDDSKKSDASNSDKSASSSDVPVWDGVGALPNPVYIPTFTFDASGCSIIPMTFSSEYLADASLPTLWCGAVATQMVSALKSAPSASGSASAGGGPVETGDDAASGATAI